MGNLGDHALGLRALVETYGVEAVVETGCGHGGSLGAILALEKPLLYFGTDIDPRAVEICKSQAPQAIIAQKKSTQFLIELLTPRVVENGVIGPFAMRTLFFLDAHSFEGVDGFPLLEELEIIAAYKPGVQRDVIICDDLRVIADEANPRYRPGELDAPYVRDEYSYVEYTNVFSRTHRVRVVPEGEGYLIFEPALTAREAGI